MPHEPDVPFGVYVRNTRLAKNLTQQDVARNGGPSQTTVSDFEKSAETSTPRIPTRKMVGLFARGLGEPVNDVEKAAGMVPGGSRPPLPPGASEEVLKKAGMHPAWLSTGDLVYLANDDPEPDATLVALEAFLTVFRQTWRARNASKTKIQAGQSA